MLDWIALKTEKKCAHAKNAVRKRKKNSERRRK